MDIEALIERLLDLDKAFGFPHLVELELPTRVATVATNELLKRLQSAQYVKPAVLEHAATRALSNLEGRPADLKQYSVCLLNLLHGPMYKTLKLTNYKTVAAAAVPHLRSKVELLKLNALGLLCRCLPKMQPDERANFADAIEMMLATEFTNVEYANEAHEYIYQLLVARPVLPKVSREHIKRALNNFAAGKEIGAEPQLHYLEETS